MQGRPKVIIAGFGCKPPSLNYLGLPSVEITEGGPKRNLGTEALSRAEPEVRIHFPPAGSHANHRFPPVLFAAGQFCHFDIVRLVRAPLSARETGGECLFFETRSFFML